MHRYKAAVLTGFAHGRVQTGKMTGIFRAAARRAFVPVGIGAFDGLGYQKIEIAHDVRRLLAMAMLARINMAIDGGDASGILVLCRVSELAPEFSRIAVVGGTGEKHGMILDNIKGMLDCKNDVAYIQEGIAMGYSADLFICPFPSRRTRSIMGLCRKETGYIALLDKGFDSMLMNGSTEGLNSVDLLIKPCNSGFSLHELRWLSRAEADSGIEIKNRDVLDMRRIGSNLGLEYRPEETKCVSRYAELQGESPGSIWGSFLLPG